jgi:K+-sensing histidine kinase KdpD
MVKSTSPRQQRRATLEIATTAGVTPNSARIFSNPTSTTRERGLGLAVVQQIVRVHGWEIECVPNEPRGAVSVSHLKIVA